MLKMIEGEASKVIALELGLSERTVEKHRKSVMGKMAVRTLAELIRRYYFYTEKV